MSDTTPPRDTEAADTEALARIILSCWADPSPEPNEIVFAKAIVSAGWISPTESAARDAAQRAAGAEAGANIVREQVRDVLNDWTSDDPRLPDLKAFASDVQQAINECSHCPVGCGQCWPPDCECYGHGDLPDKRIGGTR